MPLNIAKSDRRLLMWAGLIIFPIIVALALAPRNEEESGVPSSYSAQSRGAKAAFLLLQESGYYAEHWDDPPGELPADAVGTVLVMAFPFREPTPEDKNALVGYLSRGGRILITGASVGRFLPQAEVENEPLPSLKGKEYQPQLLTSLTRGGAVEMSPAAYWKNSSTNYLVHYAAGDRPIVVSYQYGKGQVTWWGATGPLTNAGIRNSGNMSLFLNSVGEAGHVHVFWDEYFHGSRGSLGAYVSATPIKYGLLQGLVVFLALLLTYSRRNGPVHPAQETSRLSPLEFVETLGGLYRRARATSAALEVPYARFRSIATRRLGLPSDVSVDALASAIQNRLGYKDTELAGLLHRIEGTVGRYDLKEDDVLELVQELSRHMIALKFVAEDDLLRKNN